MPSTPSRIAAGAAALLTAATVAVAAPAGAAEHRPSGQSCAGATIDRGAPVVRSSRTLVTAPVRKVWAVHTDVESYPRWKAGVTYAERLDRGPLRKGSSFRWDNGGMPIRSTVRALVRDRCTLWAGPSQGIQGVHVWRFRAVPGGTLVTTVESWSGAPVDRDPAAAGALLAKALRQGTADLERRVEQGKAR